MSTQKGDHSYSTHSIHEEDWCWWTATKSTLLVARDPLPANKLWRAFCSISVFIEWLSFAAGAATLHRHRRRYKCCWCRWTATKATLLVAHDPLSADKLWRRHPTRVFRHFLTSNHRGWRSVVLCGFRVAHVFISLSSFVNFF